MADTSKPEPVKAAPAKAAAAKASGPDNEPHADVEELRRENARLRAENEILRAGGTPTPATTRRAPEPASFGLSEGTRQELKERGEATDPFSGERVTRADYPDHDVAPDERPGDRRRPDERQ